MAETPKYYEKSDDDKYFRRPNPDDTPSPWIPISCQVEKSAHIHKSSEIQKHVRIGKDVFISQLVTIESYSVIDHGAILHESSLIEENVYIGIGSVVFGDTTVPCNLYVFPNTIFN